VSNHLVQWVLTVSISDDQLICFQSVVDFLTEEVTHLITDADPNSAGQDSPSNKENNPSSRTIAPHLLGSPVKLRNG
jgi:hypothetical protein